jgi:hypothetical protein
MNKIKEYIDLLDVQIMEHYQNLMTFDKQIADLKDQINCWFDKNPKEDVSQALAYEIVTLLQINSINRINIKAGNEAIHLSAACNREFRKDVAKSFKKYEMGRNNANEKRHQPTKEVKAEIFEKWSSTFNPKESSSKAAERLYLPKYKRYMSYKTLYEQICKWKKARISNN